MTLIRWFRSLFVPEYHDIDIEDVHHRLHVKNDLDEMRSRLQRIRALQTEESVLTQSALDSLEHDTEI